MICHTRPEGLHIRNRPFSHRTPWADIDHLLALRETSMREEAPTEVEHQRPSHSDIATPSSKPSPGDAPAQQASSPECPPGAARDSLHLIIREEPAPPPPVSSSPTRPGDFPITPDFWDILFSLRHSITRNAIVVSIFMDILNIVQVFLGSFRILMHQLAVVIIVLFISRHDRCDIPLRGFLYFYSSRLGFSLIHAIFSYVNLKINLVGPVHLRFLDL